MTIFRNYKKRTMIHSADYEPQKEEILFSEGKVLTLINSVGELQM
jgi:hypothetical protein